jgi:AcrR family transcriptional regulator
VPRAGLTTALVVAEAARIADEVGFERLTLSAVAHRFGVAVPSLYKHVDGLAALRRRISALALTELGDALATAVEGRSGHEALRALAGAYRRYAGSHPGRYGATLRAPEPSHEDAAAAAGRLLEVVLVVLEGYRLRGDDAVDATRALRSALHGFVSLEGAGGFGMPRDVDRSFDRMVEAFDAALAGWASRSRRKR